MARSFHPKIGDASASEYVNVLDTETRELTRIPASELGPDMLELRVEEGETPSISTPAICRCSTTSIPPLAKTVSL